MVIFQCLVKNYKVSAGVGWHIPPIPALRWQRQKDQEFKVISGCLRNLNSDERREGGREGGKVGREKDGRKKKKEKQEGRGNKEERRGGRKKGKRRKERKKEDREREKGEDEMF